MHTERTALELALTMRTVKYVACNVVVQVLAQVQVQGVHFHVEHMFMHTLSCVLDCSRVGFDNVDSKVCGL